MGCLVDDMDAHCPVPVERRHGSVASHDVAHMGAETGPIDLGFGTLTPNSQVESGPQGVGSVGRCPQGGCRQAPLLGPRRFANQDDRNAQKRPGGGKGQACGPSSHHAQIRLQRRAAFVQGLFHPSVSLRRACHFLTRMGPSARRPSAARAIMSCGVSKLSG